MQPLGNRHYFPNSQLNLPVGKVRCRPLGARDLRATVCERGRGKSQDFLLRDVRLSPPNCMNRLF